MPFDGSVSLALSVCPWLLLYRFSQFGQTLLSSTSSSSFFFIFNYFFSSSNWLFHLRPFSFLLAVRFPAKHCWHVSTTDSAGYTRMTSGFFFFQIVFWPSPHNFLGPFLFKKREKYFLFSPINSVYTLSFVSKFYFPCLSSFFEWGKRSIQPRLTRRRVCACGCRAEFIADERLAPLEIKWNQRRFIHSFGQHQRKEKKKIEKKSPSKRNDDLVDFGM